MKRRSVLLGVGALASMGLAGAAPRLSTRTLDVKLWLTEPAAGYPASRERAAGYLSRALEVAGVPADVTFGGTVPRPAGRSDRALERRVWPRQVVRGALGQSDLEPVDDVNLLLTDGEVRRPSAGYAYPHVAAVPGASRLADMPPVDGGASVVPYTARTAVTQLVLHEVGHALGLSHRDGAVSVDEGAVTASPMLGGYAWATGAGDPAGPDHHDQACADPLPADLTGERRLSLAFSACASRSLRAYAGGGPVSAARSD